MIFVRLQVTKVVVLLNGYGIIGILSIDIQVVREFLWERHL
nr:MAG TPA: hypothetical protein [Caudoviricetes sp.]